MGETNTNTYALTDPQVEVWYKLLIGSSFYLDNHYDMFGEHFWKFDVSYL